VRSPPAQPTYTPQRHAPVARPSGTPQRHAPASGTPQWHAPAARSSSTPQWQLIQRQPHEAQCFIVSQVNDRTRLKAKFAIEGQASTASAHARTHSSCEPQWQAASTILSRLKAKGRSENKPQRLNNSQELVAPASPSGISHQR